MLRAIVFDFDGVVVDSEPLHYQAFVLVGKGIGFEFTYEQYLATYIGFDDRDAFRVMLGAAGREVTEAKIAELCTQKQRAFDAVAAMGQGRAGEPGENKSGDGGTLAIPGALALIDECYAVDFPRAIASGATRQDIDLMLGLLDRRDRFEIIVTADDVAYSKPDPASYALAVDRLEIDPDHTLAIEDTVAGLISAREAGLRTLALATTTDADKLRGHADRVIDDLTGIDLEQLRMWY